MVGGLVVVASCKSDDMVGVVVLPVPKVMTAGVGVVGMIVTVVVVGMVGTVTLGRV